GVAGVGGVENVARGDLAFAHEASQGGLAFTGLQRLKGALDDAGRAGVGLQATPTAAAALAWAGHLDLDVPDLGAVTVLALDDQVADDDATADTGAEREQHHAVGVLAGAEPELAVGRRVGIVLEGRRHAEPVLNVLAHRDVPPRLEVRRVEDH